MISDDISNNDVMMKGPNINTYGCVYFSFSAALVSGMLIRDVAIAHV